MGIKLLAHLDPRPSFSEKGRRLRDAFLHRPATFPAELAATTIVHCPYQMVHPLVPDAWNLPYVINLHDIQHEHYPEFFTLDELAWRREHYLASAHHATALCVVDEWTRRDLVNHLPIDPEKVFVAPFGPTWDIPHASDDSVWKSLQRERGLPEAFAYYPAQTWIHKNHARLFEALHHLATQGIKIPLVCSGHLTERHAELAQKAKELGIDVHFLGLVKDVEVRAMYRQARMVVIPTLFEGGSGIPVLEAMALGVPLAASTACGIPEAVEDAALLFDPLEPGEMAHVIGRLWGDPELRKTLAQRGLKRSQNWNWGRAAATYRDIYTEVLARWKAPPRRNRACE
ncbi:MAG: glycosyltransferase family 1 protein [Geothrix sp.]|nr:glycosyltransferase family 1 protein [Geothrix sp.]